MDDPFYEKVTQPVITCSKLTTETLEQSVSIVNFEQVNAGWDRTEISVHSPFSKVLHIFLESNRVGKCFEICN